MKDGDDYVAALKGLIRASSAEDHQLQDDLANLKDCMTNHLSLQVSGNLLQSQ
jgi:hypothetical protein